MSISVALGWALPATAQDDNNLALPVHFMACNYRDGKNMKDLDKVLEDFKRYATRHNSKYTAWMLIPQYHDDPDMFDIGWLGTWPDAVTFGESQDRWFTTGRELAAAIDQVVDCSLRHELISSQVLYAPTGPLADGVLIFSQCTLKEGKTLKDALKAQRQVARAMEEMGSPASSWFFQPGLGAGNVDYDYWRVVGFNNYVGLGVAVENFYNRGGRERTLEIIGSVASCTSMTTFHARQIRRGLTRDKL